MEKIRDLRLAVLIDADNVPYANVKQMFEELAKYGTPTFKRIYADWTKPTVSGWKTVLLENAITPVQQYSYTTGKNSSDSALIIDAMDILYSGKVDGFCIVSSDSDFTRLATRLREAGMKVFGIGEKKTPISFISACEKFIYIEILKTEHSDSIILKKKINKKPIKGKITKEAIPEIVQEFITETPPEIVPEIIRKASVLNKIDKSLIKLLTDSVNDLADEQGWAFLGDLGNHLLKKKPDFDSRNYGFSKMLPLLKNISNFQVDERDSGKGNIKLVYIKIK